jgi:hypothetical protein
MRTDKSRRIESAKKRWDEHSRDMMNYKTFEGGTPLSDLAHLKCRLCGE